HRLQADVEGGGAAVDLGVGDEALFYAEDVQRLHPIGAAAEGLGLGHEEAVERVAVTGGDGDLVGALTGEGDPEKASRNLADGDGAAGHERKFVIRNRSFEDGIQAVERLRAGN